MRTLVIGDIHGCCQALVGLLNAIAPGRDDLVICLGDYVDRGPDSRGVIESLLQLSKTVPTVFLLGNHEIMFRGALSGLDPQPWLELGGQSTLASYGGDLNNVPVEHRDFLAKCQPFFETASHIFLHANYAPELPMDQQDEYSLYWQHLNERLPAPHCSGKTVICGHTPQLDGEIADFGHLVCIDTFCFGNGYLTCLDPVSGQTWQTDNAGKLRKARTFWQRLGGRS